jgi:hypothetical protein
MGSTLVSLLLLELGHRGLLRLQGRPYDPREAREMVLEIASRLRDPVGAPADEVEVRELGYHAHPYFGVEGFGIQEQIEENLEQQWRLEEGSRPSSQPPYWILLVGGSVAQDFGMRGMPALIERLEADPRFRERPIRVLFLAQPGLKQPQQLTLLAYGLALGLHVDAVINIDGFNELALANSNIRDQGNPLYPFLPFWVRVARSGNEDRYSMDRLLECRSAQREAVALANRATAYDVFVSSVLGRLTVRRMRRIEQKAARAQAEYAKHHGELEVVRVEDKQVARPLLGPKHRSRDSLQSLVDCWTTCSRAMRVLCEDRSIFYLHVLQPTLHDPGSKPLTPEEIAKGGCDPAWEEAVGLGYARLRSAGRELQGSGEHFVDASLVFGDVEETLYFDHCHFVEEGHLILADEIAGALLEMLPEVLSKPGLPGPERGGPSPKRWSSTRLKGWRYLDGVPIQVCMPEGELVFDLPAGAREVHGWFGMLPAAHRFGDTDGVLFTVELDLGAERGSLVLFERALDPAQEETDRGFQEFRLELPADACGTLLLRTSNEPGKNELADGSFWSGLEIR